MYRQTTKLKKSLSRPRYRQILEIIGLSKTPLSRVEISKKWNEKYPPTNYVFEVINNLYKPGNLYESERFLSVSYNEKSRYKIAQLEEIKRHTYSDKDIEAELKINEIKKNYKNWKYTLNLKGLLLYLISAHYHNENANKIALEVRKEKKQNEIAKDKQIVTIKTIDEVIKNSSNINYSITNLKFLHHFDPFRNMFDKRTRVEILTMIALELQNVLKIWTKVALKEYVLRRCYEELDMILNMKDSWFSRRLPRTKKQIQELDLLQYTESRILDILIELEEQRIKEMKEKLTKMQNGKYLFYSSLQRSYFRS